MVRMIRDAISERCLRVYFNEDVNLLTGYTLESVVPVLHYLDDIIKKQADAKLVNIP